MFPKNFYLKKTNSLLEIKIVFFIIRKEFLYLNYPTHSKEDGTVIFLPLCDIFLPSTFKRSFGGDGLVDHKLDYI